MDLAPVQIHCGMVCGRPATCGLGGDGRWRPSAGDSAAAFVFTTSVMVDDDSDVGMDLSGSMPTTGSG